jgi:hypothetical protein
MTNLGLQALRAAEKLVRYTVSLGKLQRFREMDIVWCSERIAKCLRIDSVSTHRLGMRSS